ncbi:MAG TPA: DUF2330 domain-containing protein [Roseiflexaceae bacterium]|nr:DUF2330 domain-containing protein [Roseiflexaceae bacterium]
MLTLSIWLAAPVAALACGMPLDARIPSEQALIVYSGGRQEIITSIQILSEKPGAAVIFPVPGVPEVEALSSDTLFSFLAEVTRPLEQLEERLVWRNTDGTAGGAAPGSVNVLGQEIVGGYSVARLQADDPSALQAWLDQNGYSAPQEATPILQAYTDAGWTFVAVKLAPDQHAAGALKPLRIAFDSPEIVYPMRLGALSDRPVDVLLYVLTDHRVDIAGMETQYAGPVAQLDRAPPAELAPIFAAPYLTKLRNSAIVPATLTTDFVARRAATDEPFRKAIVRTVYVDAWSRMGPPIAGVVLVLVSSVVALAFAFGLRRRMNEIAGSESGEDET